MPLLAIMYKWNATRSTAASPGIMLRRLVAGTEKVSQNILQQQRLQQRRSFSSNEQKKWEVVDMEEEEEEHSKIPWRYLIEPAAKALWRSSPHNPPFDLADESYHIIQESNRSNKQLKYTHHLACDNHKSLALRRERDRRDEVNGKNKAGKNPTEYNSTAKTGKQPVYYTPDQTLAFMKYRLLPNYAIAKRVLMEAQSLVGSNTPWEPRRIIDFGIGCGSASAAAMDVFSSNDNNDNDDGDSKKTTTIEWIHGIDASQSMRDGANRILQRYLKQYSSTDQPRITLSESLAAERSGGSETSRGGFDMALCTYTATELPHVNSTLAAAAILWEKLRPNGLFVMIEPGTPDGFNSIRAVRSMLLDCCPPNQPNDEQCHVLAPCTHNGKCPMERHQRDFLKKNKAENTRVDDDNVDEDDNDDEDYDSFEGSDHEKDEDSDVDWDEDDNDDEFDWEELNEASKFLPQESPVFQEEPNMLEKREKDTKKIRSKIPMGETEMYHNAFCSFVHKFPSGGGPKQQAQGEKFSYLVLQKRVASDHDCNEWEKDYNPFHSSNVVDLLAQSHESAKSIRGGRKKKKRNERVKKDPEKHKELIREAQELHSRYLEASTGDKLGLELIRGDTSRKSFGRIVRGPRKKRGHVYIDYCSGSIKNGDGRIVRHCLSKSWCKHIAPGLYSAGRKARWGGYWPDIMERISDNEDES